MFTSEHSLREENNWAILFKDHGSEVVQDFSVHYLVTANGKGICNVRVEIFLCAEKWKKKRAFIKERPCWNYECIGDQ